VLLKLESRGILSRVDGELRIPKATKNIIKNYFVLNQYQSFKGLITQQLKKKVSERISNLFLLGLVKRILTSSRIPKTSDPFCVVRRSLVKDVSEDDLKEATKLGVIFLTSNEVIIAHEVLSELESIFRSAISEKSIIRIPANDVYTAIVTWRRIFSECKEYVKVQDEYVNEETLRIIQSYSPDQVRIIILSSIEGARDADLEEMKQIVDVIKNSGRKIDLLFVGKGPLGKAPFHERYIISKDTCYWLSTSIKQIGKSKSASIGLVPMDKKEGEVEPAFNYWAFHSAKRLGEIGIKRVKFDEWLKHKASV